MQKKFDLPPLTLITGGAASGKSDYAERLVRASGRDKVYLATSRVWDEEMQLKVHRHIEMRGPDWRTIEAEINLIPAMQSLQDNEIMLVDCATMWLTNVVFDDVDTREAASGLFDALNYAKAPVVIVTNELGQGIVPEDKMSRSFRNLHGKMNQVLATRADWVFGVMSGLPFTLKGPDSKGLLEEEV